MIPIELDELGRHPEWRQVLSAYEQRHAAAREQSPDFDGWQERFLTVEGVLPDRLAKVHGRLIAAGYLKIQLVDRAAGLRYQLSAEGRRALAGDSGSSDDTSDESDSDLSAAA